MRYTPQQNGVSERLNRIIMKRARCLLSDVILEEKLWAKVVVYAMYTLNRSAHTSLGFLISEEKWSKPMETKGRATKCMFVPFTKGVEKFMAPHWKEVYNQ